MDYFKELAGEYITKEHEGVVNSFVLDKTLADYIDKGYKEFKLTYTGTAGTPPHEVREYRLTARGDRAKIKQKIRQWYPDLIDE